MTKAEVSGPARHRPAWSDRLGCAPSPSLQPEVGKIKIVYLYLYFYLRHDMSATSFTLRRRVGIVRLMLKTLDLPGIGHDVFYIETIPRDRDRQRLTKIAVEGKILILVHNS
jgi:hypothetical protein